MAEQTPHNHYGPTTCSPGCPWYGVADAPHTTSRPPMTEQTPDLREQIEQTLYHHDYIDRTPGTARDCRSAADAVMTVVSPEVKRLDDLLREANEDGFGWKPRAEVAEAEVKRLRAALAGVRRALDDELANLADDGARLSHSVVRRIEAALAARHGGHR